MYCSYVLVLVLIILKSLPALILRVLASTSSMATARMETTCGPTYSMARAIGAATGKKVSSVDAILYLRCH